MQEGMIAADPREIETGEEAMVARVMDGMNKEFIASLFSGLPGIASVDMKGLQLAAHKGEPVFQLDLLVHVSGRAQVELALPHISRDKEALARRSRKFWEGLVERHKSS